MLRTASLSQAITPAVKKTPSSPTSALLGAALPTEAKYGLQASLRELDLLNAVELVHSARQSGVLQVHAQLFGGLLPLELAFEAGELMACSVLDWRGIDTLLAYPQGVKAGELSFWQFDTAGLRQILPQTALLHEPFSGLMGEWARMSDEWPRVLQHMPSLSQRFYGNLEPFNRRGGASVRRVVAMTRQPLFEVAQQVAALAEAGILRPVKDSFEWDLMVLPPPADTSGTSHNSVLRLLDGKKPLAHLIRRGLEPQRLRRELLPRIGQDWQFSGAGRVLRDWLWEIEAEENRG